MQDVQVKELQKILKDDNVKAYNAYAKKNGLSHEIELTLLQLQRFTTDSLRFDLSDERANKTKLVEILALAVFSGALNIVSSLYSHGQTKPRELPYNYLQLSLYVKHSGLTNFFLSKGLDPLACDDEGANCLQLAVAQEMVDVVEELVKRDDIKVQINQLTSDDKHILEYVMFHANARIVYLLLNAGASFTVPGMSGRFFATLLDHRGRGATPSLTKAYHMKAEIPRKLQEILEILNHCAEYDIDITEPLIALSPAMKEVIGNNRNTGPFAPAQYVSCFLGPFKSLLLLEVDRALVEFSEQATALTEKYVNQAKLYKAIQQGNFDSVQQYLPRSAGIDAHKGRALYYALSNGHSRIVHYLVEQGASILPRHYFAAGQAKDLDSAITCMQFLCKSFSIDAKQLNGLTPVLIEKHIHATQPTSLLILARSYFLCGRLVQLEGGGMRKARPLFAHLNTLSVPAIDERTIDLWYACANKKVAVAIDLVQKGASLTAVHPDTGFTAIDFADMWKKEINDFAEKLRYANAPKHYESEQINRPQRRQDQKRKQNGKREHQRSKQQETKQAQPAAL